MIYRLLTLSLACLLFLPSLVLAETGDRAFDLLYIKDPNAQLSLDEAKASDQWQMVEGTRINFGFTPALFWFKATPIPDKMPCSTCYFVIDNPLVDQLDIFLFRNGELIERLTLGDSQEFHKRVVDDAQFVIPFDYSPDTDIAIYMRARNHDAMWYGVSLLDKKQFFELNQYRKYLFGVMYGIYLILILFHLVYYFQFNVSSHLHFALFFMSVGLAFGVHHGLAFQFLWPDFPFLNQLSNPLTIGLCVATGAGFTRHYLDLGNWSGNASWWLRLVSWSGLTVGFLSIFVDMTLAIRIGLIVALVALLIIVAVGIAAWRRGDEEGRFFCIGWLVFASGTLMLILTSLGIMPFLNITRYSILFSATAGAAIWSFGLVHHLVSQRAELIEQQTEAIAQCQMELADQEEHIDDQEKKIEELQDHLARTRARLEKLNTKDGLTGVRNRTFFDQQIQDEWRRAHRTHTCLGLLIIDIDDFKQLNEYKGHLVGDECLKILALTILSCAGRVTDFVARYSGDQFVVLVANTSHHGLKTLANRILHDVRQIEEQKNGIDIEFTVSIGGTYSTPEEVDQWEDMLTKADAALYQAKQQGKNRFSLSL